MLNIGIIAAVLSMLFAVVGSIISKKIAKPLGDWLAALCIMAVGMTLMGVAVLIFHTQFLAVNQLVLPIIASLFLALGFIFRFSYLREGGQITNAVGLGEIQQLIIVLAGLLLFEEVTTQMQVLGIIIVLIGFVFLMTTESRKIDRRAIPTVFASICWAIYWIVIVFSVNSSNNFLMSLFVSRLSGTILLILFIVLFKRKQVTEAATRLIDMRTQGLILFLGGITIGITNGLGDTFFGVVTKYKIVAIGAIIGALFPVLVALLAYFIYKERLEKHQIVGFAIMVIGVFLVSI